MRSDFAEGSAVVYENSGSSVDLPCPVLCFLTLDDTTDGLLCFVVVATGPDLSLAKRNAAIGLALKLFFLTPRMTVLLSDMDGFDIGTTLFDGLIDLTEGFLSTVHLHVVDLAIGETADLVDVPRNDLGLSMGEIADLAVKPREDLELVEIRRIGTITGLARPDVTGSFDEVTDVRDEVEPLTDFFLVTG